jgi:hypothetical protein
MLTCNGRSRATVTSYVLKGAATVTSYVLMESLTSRRSRVLDLRVGSDINCIAPLHTIKSARQAFNIG